METARKVRTVQPATTRVQLYCCCCINDDAHAKQAKGIRFWDIMHGTPHVFVLEIYYWNYPIFRSHLKNLEPIPVLLGRVPFSVNRRCGPIRWSTRNAIAIGAAKCFTFSCVP
ncbi:hypothetical protein L2E82_50520 [Cichorium intybus]|nr:hypothetical protein L2E82_50520 [Cichorium intybus]